VRTETWFPLMNKNDLGIKCEDGDLVSSDEQKRRQILGNEVQPGHVQQWRH
jgi:hypothetical protein